MSIGALYAHPVEYVFGNMLPIGIPIGLLGKNMHFFTLMILIAFRLAGTTYGHSGYDFPWSPISLLPLRTDTPYHNYHHTSNVGNYANIFTIWDTIMGYNGTYYKHLKKLSVKKEK